MENDRPMPAAIVPYDDVVSRLFEVFRDQGFAGASISQIAEATGLGRSSLYHYFPGGKEDMALAVLQRVESSMRERLFEPLRASSAPAKRLKAMLETYDEMYDGGRDVCLLGTLVLGGSRARFQRPLKEIFETWITALAGLAADAGVPAKTARERAEDAVLRIQGALILAGGLDDTAPFRRTLKTLAKEFFA
jgi:TetR/AcrR family transcriptional regulator, lmrAB and yxaGH operons repressor